MSRMREFRRVNKSLGGAATRHTAFQVSTNANKEIVICRDACLAIWIISWKHQPLIICASNWSALKWFRVQLRLQTLVAPHWSSQLNQALFINTGISCVLKSRRQVICFQFSETFRQMKLQGYALSSTAQYFNGNLTNSTKHYVKLSASFISLSTCTRKMSGYL